MGEALCAFFSVRCGLETVSLRIGAFEKLVRNNLKTPRDLSAWLSPRDAVHLLDQALSAEVDGSIVVNGISNNRFKRLDIEMARKLIGYKPVDDAFAHFHMPIASLSSDKCG